MAVANWYPDPADPSRLRWWDGTAWTEHTAARPAQLQVAGPTQAPGYAGPSAYGGNAVPPPGFGAPGTPYPGQYVYVDPHNPVVRRESGRAFLPASAVAAGVAPDRCCRHGQRVAATRKTTLQSRLPAWSYLTILAGLLVFVVVATVIRKSVKAPAWPFCRTCLDRRRRDLACMWVAILLVVPGMVAVGSVGDALGPDNTGVAMLLMVLVVVGLPIAAVVFGIRGSLERISGAQVSADGLLVSVPDSAYPEASAARIASAMGL